MASTPDIVEEIASFVAVGVRDQVMCRELRFVGCPVEVLESSTSPALALLLEKLGEI